MVVTLFHFDQVPFVEAVRQGHESFIPLFVSCLIAAHQQHGIPLGVESIQGPIGPALVPMRNSRMWGYRLPEIPEEWGNFNSIPSRASRSTE
jgi:hypothetical protein